MEIEIQHNMGLDRFRDGVGSPPSAMVADKELVIDLTDGKVSPEGHHDCMSLSSTHRRRAAHATTT